MTRLPFLHLALALAFAAIHGGCATSIAPPNRPNTGARTGYSTAASSASVLDAAELASIDVATAYEAILRLRPEFLSRRGISRPSEPGGEAPVVYLNGVRQGPIEMLRSIPASWLKEIRLLSPMEAENLLGPGHLGGVIAVYTRR